MNVSPEYAEIARRLGRRIRYCRKARGLTLKIVAGHVGASISALSDIERGYSLPSIPRLVQIAGAFDMRASELMEGVNVP